MFSGLFSFDMVYVSHSQILNYVRFLNLYHGYGFFNAICSEIYRYGMINLDYSFTHLCSSMKMSTINGTADYCSSLLDGHPITIARWQGLDNYSYLALTN